MSKVPSMGLACSRRSVSARQQPLLHGVKPDSFLHVSSQI